jgi:hypothetical protein
VDVRLADHSISQIEQAPDFSPFDAEVGFPKENLVADQHSTLNLTPDGAVFRALSDARGTDATASFDSTFHVGFEVTKPVEYTLNYVFGASGAGNDITPSALFIGPSGTQDISHGVNESGVLQPGAYQLQIDAVGGVNITYSVNFAAVPLPSAFWAVMAMLPLLMAGWRFRGRILLFK